MVFLIVSTSGLLWVFSVVSSSQGYVIGSINGTVTLPCIYSTNEGTHTMCWGQGTCSTLQVYCAKTILKTNSTGVTWRESDRYRLLGNITEGDVSLTITGATKQDEGTYCCRVEVPGLFNDKMTDLTLKVSEDIDHEELHTSLPNHWAFTTSTQALLTNSEPRNGKILQTYIILICVILIVVFLPVVLYIYKFKKRKESVMTRHMTELHNLSSPVNPMVENVYIVE